MTFRRRDAQAGIPRPQGRAIERAPPSLGFAGVRHVRQGKHFELDVDDSA